MDNINILNVTNNLGFLIDRLQAIKTIEENRRVSLIEIETDISDYIGLTIRGLKHIKHGDSQGTIKTALLLHDYFVKNLDDTIDFKDLYSLE